MLDIVVFDSGQRQWTVWCHENLSTNYQSHIRFVVRFVRRRNIFSY